MPFVIRKQADARYAIFKLHPGGDLSLCGQPHYKTEKSAQAAANRWMRGAKSPSPGATA